MRRFLFVVSIVFCVFCASCVSNQESESKTDAEEKSATSVEAEESVPKSTEKSEKIDEDAPTAVGTLPKKETAGQIEKSPSVKGSPAVAPTAASKTDKTAASSSGAAASSSVKVLPISATASTSANAVIDDYATAVLESYCRAYPDKNMQVSFRDGDSCITVDGKIFFWADGRLLPEKLVTQKNKYGLQQIYAYSGKPRDPSLYTQEQIEELRRKGTKDEIASEKPVDTSFTCQLLNVGDRNVTEAKIVKTKLFGFRLNIHERLVPIVQQIDEEVRVLAQTEKDVQAFLSSIYELGGYNWRTIDGTNERRSYHSYGAAIDVSIKNNQKTTYWEWERVWNPDWMLVPQRRLWTPPDSVIKVFDKYGFVWGGTWDEYDTMHFEYRPELHILSQILNEIS